MERRLLINECNACGRLHHPPRPVCPACHSFDIGQAEVSGRGTIHLVMFLHQGPPAPGVDYSTPYPVATVELDEQDGLRFTGTVEGADHGEITIGQRVGLHWIERSGVPVPAFRILAEEAV